MNRRQAEQDVIHMARAVCSGHKSVTDLWSTIWRLDHEVETPAAPRSNSILLTSQNAAAYMTGRRAKSVAAQIVKMLRHRWQTSDELEANLHRPHQTVSARVNELRNAGWIEPSGTTRATRSGQEATVWKLTPRARSIIAGEE